MVCPEIPDESSTAEMEDAYFQLKFLHEAGYQVILHCFYDDKIAVTRHLEDITCHIHYYARKQGHKGVSMRHPYCISSRSDALLLENLLQYKCPVLFQGITCTYHLPELAANGYKTMVRLNGIASSLFEAFTRCEKSLVKKVYSFNEARLIKRWEKKIAGQSLIITTTPSDQQKFQELYNGSCTHFLPPCMSRPEVTAIAGTGMYCLYYGDLANAENEKMVHWLFENIFRTIAVPLIVADTGNTVNIQPDPESNICMVSNPDATALSELMQKAQLILLPRCHNNGFDKRLVKALEKGRHCICNDQMIDDTGLEDLFIIANGAKEMTDAINRYFSVSFTDRDILDRTRRLSNCYCAGQASNRLLEIIES